jgi:NADH:ubiquinone oxidoreductase subunit K
MSKRVQNIPVYRIIRVMLCALGVSYMAKAPANSANIKYVTWDVMPTHTHFFLRIKDLHALLWDFYTPISGVKLPVEITRDLSSLEYHMLILIFSIFFIGIYGMLKNMHNLLIFICYLELASLSSFLLFVLASIWYVSIECQIYALLILIITAVDTSIGLSIAVFNYRLTTRNIWF